MTVKLPRSTLHELERLVEQLTRGDADKRNIAMNRLSDYERSGKIPLDLLLELSEAEKPSVSMYAITALGRNGQPSAVNKLIALMEKHKTSNPLFLETIIDALGDAKNPKAAAVLLGLIGIKRGLTGKLFGRRGRKNNPEEEGHDEGLREFLTLSVIRALEKIQDPGATKLLADYLAHPDPIVRWHIIQTILKCGLAEFNGQLREMAGRDDNKLVREMADIAVSKLEPLPPNLNN